MYKIVEKKVKLELCENPIPIDYNEVPGYSKQDFETRIDNLMKMAREKKYSSVVIYADREHHTNISYFTGFDVRFEEALLIFTEGEIPTLLVGNEGFVYCNLIPINIKRVLYQPFGLMGQPGKKVPLLELLKDCGITKESKVGIIGWKEYCEVSAVADKSILDLPYYIIDTLCKIVEIKQLENAVDLMSDNNYGLKHNISAKEAVNFELQGTRVSRSVYNVIKNLREGMTEIDASGYLQLDGEPTCTHPNVNFGDFNASLGLRSPTYDTKLRIGDPCGVGFGYRGTQVHKSGFYIRSIGDLPKEKQHYMDSFLKPYFSSIVKWYEMMHIGTSCGDIYDEIDSMIGLEKFGVFLNPGHLIHTEEWSNAPFLKGNETKIRSGMAIQCDYTVSFQNPFFTAHVEDGIIIADKQLRDEIKALSPSCYSRIEARRRFYKEVLNIELADEVLPTSDIGGVCFPYMADTSVLLCKA